MPDDRRCCPLCHVPEPHGCNCEPEHEDPEELIANEFEFVVTRYNPEGVWIKRWWKPASKT